ncbi:MAG: hypothetical protein FJ291_02765 [Planctomycetes bacterium]|nr:hypothetical protein [Planctomycetota bacterium]
MELAGARAMLERLRQTADRYTELYLPLNLVDNLLNQYDQTAEALRSQHGAPFEDLQRAERPQQADVLAGTCGGPRMISRRILDALQLRVDYCLAVVSDVLARGGSTLSVKKQGAFFAGQQFDAFKLVHDIASVAGKSIEIVDAYLGVDMLDLLQCTNPGVTIKLVTDDRHLRADVTRAAQKFNLDASRHGRVAMRTSRAFHDRFLIVDDTDYYHFGASFNHLGSRGCMFSLIEEPGVKTTVRQMFDQEWARGNDPLCSP